MKTPLVLLLLFWTSLALALGDGKVRGPITPRLLQDKHALISGLSMGQPATPQTSVASMNAQGYNPWVEQVTGLPSDKGIVHVYAVDDNIVWAMSNDGACARTTDGGTTWVCNTAPIEAGCNNPTIYAFDADRAWVSMVDYNGVRGGGIYHTTNGGTTWQRNPSAFETLGGWPNFIHFFDADNGVCGGDPTNGYFEIYTTSDAGTTWSRVPQANIPDMIPEEVGYWRYFSAAGNSLWFITTGTGRYFRTTDRGLTWSVHVYPGIQLNGVPMFAFQDANVGIGHGSLGEVSRTTDGGSTWARVSSSLPLLFDYTEYIPGTSGMYIGRTYYNRPGIEGNPLWGMAYTTDSGVSWTMTGEFYSSQWMDFASASAGWLSNSGPNIYKWTTAQGRVVGTSVDTLRFLALEAGQVSDTIIVDAANFGSDPLTLSGIVAPGPNFTVTNHSSFPATLTPLGSARFGLRFTPQTRGEFLDSLVILSDATNGSAITVRLSGTAFQFTPPLPGYIYASAASLYTFSLANLTASSVGPLGGVTIHGLSVRPADSLLFGVRAANPTSTLYKIDPIVGRSTPVVSVKVSNLRAIAFSKSGTLFGGTRAGRLVRINIDTGDTTGIGSDPGKVYNSFAFNPTNGMLYASVYPTSGAQKDTLYTIDTLTGKATPVGRTGDGAVTPSIAFNADGTLYGLKGTGATINTLIRISVADGQGTEIGSLGTSGLQAITMLDLATNIEENLVRQLPAAYEVFQNYPNPFNPTTTLRVALPWRSQVIIKVFDMLGRDVATVTNTVMDVGTKDVVFDATALASGIYFYQVQVRSLEGGQTETFVQTRKMVVLR